MASSRVCYFPGSNLVRPDNFFALTNIFYFAIYRMPPGQEMDDWMTIIRSGMWRLYYQLSAEGRKRYYQELLPVLHKAKVETMGDRDNECYYLVYLGTKPAGQRRGYARKLIQQMASKVRHLT